MANVTDKTTYEKELAKEVLRTSANISLYLAYFTVRFVASEFLSTPSKGIYGALRDSSVFAASVSWEQFRKSFMYIKKRGDIKVISREGFKRLQITEQGLDRLNSLLPQYQKKRDWDKKLYIITYDIPTLFNLHRDKIRNAILQLGAGKLQDSVYVTPYNPRFSLRKFIKEYKIKGDVLVSDLGADGSVAGKNINQIISEVYSIDKLNERYKDYLKKFSQLDRSTRKLKPKPGADTIISEFEYISILRDDPQLPFELLPQWWLGDKAYQIYDLINNSRKPRSRSSKH